MKKKQIASIYARVLFLIGEEKKIDFIDEMIKFQKLLNISSDLELLLSSEVFSIEEKLEVIEVVCKRYQYETYMHNFLHILVQKRRFFLFPLIFSDLVRLKDKSMGHIRGTLEGHNVFLPPKHMDAMKKYIQQFFDLEVILEYHRCPSISVGYRIKVGNLQLNASLENQLFLFKHDIFDD